MVRGVRDASQLQEWQRIEQTRPGSPRAFPRDSNGTRGLTQRCGSVGSYDIFIATGDNAVMYAESMVDILICRRRAMTSGEPSNLGAGRLLNLR